MASLVALTLGLLMAGSPLVIARCFYGQWGFCFEDSSLPVQVDSSSVARLADAGEFASTGDQERTGNSSETPRLAEAVSTVHTDWCAICCFAGGTCAFCLSGSGPLVSDPSGSLLPSAAPIGRKVQS